VPELEVLGRNYGVMLRIQYKQKLSDWLKNSLDEDERVYHLSGHDLAIRLTPSRTRAGLTRWMPKLRRFVSSGMICRCSRR
jgi:GGDEF domain-containing protein